MLSAVTKRLVKKLGADAFTSQDSVEDNMRKVDEGYVCVLFLQFFRWCFCLIIICGLLLYLIN